MENDFKREAGRQYLHYFRFWFLAVGILAVICCALYFVKQGEGGAPRTNNEAPKGRVFDYAEVLSQQEEAYLAQYIADREEKLEMDIVLVTISQPVEGEEARTEYGLRFTDWERNMQDIADDFWDENHFGYNKGFEGDGVLLLYNWYEGQKGEVLSTSGRAERMLGSRDIERIFDAVDAYHSMDPCRAYQAYVDKVDDLLNTSGIVSVPWAVVFILPIVIAASYTVSGAKQAKTHNTVAVNAYVEGGKPTVNTNEDVLLRKSVAARKIVTESESGRGGRSGGGGHHYSGSGASHGGGSRRH